MRTRVIPCLTLSEGGLVKTTQFRNPQYVGDPINAMRIFNEKEVDELVLLDISASSLGRRPDFALIEEIAQEAFMPVSYGGGIRSVEDAARIIGIGVEKVVVNTAVYEKPQLISELARRFGSQSVVGSIDTVRIGGRWEIVRSGGRVSADLNPQAAARRMADEGVGEILLASVNRDGTREGYDVDLIQAVSQAVDVPIIAVGGAGRIEDFAAAVKAGASAVAAGAFFVYHGPHRAVLISYPERKVLESVLP